MEQYEEHLRYCSSFCRMKFSIMPQTEALCYLQSQYIPSKWKHTRKNMQEVAPIKRL